MTYNEIISQVLRRLGVSGLSNELKADIRVAISWAEQELLTEAKPNVSQTIIVTNSSRAEYQLPSDCEFHKELIPYDSSDQPMACEEAVIDEWYRWNPNADTGGENDVVDEHLNIESVVSSARYGGKILFAVANVDGVKTLHIKPAFDGKVLLIYSPKRNEDIFDDLNSEPTIQSEYHQYIIPGAVYYLSQIKGGEAKSKGDMASVDFYARLEANSYGQFNRMKLKLIEKSNTTSHPIVAKAFTWYDNPHKYR